jgi:arginyl-tRNA synthetase
MEAARQATYALQRGHPGYRALWKHVYDVSVADLRADYAELNIEFDLWLGESDTQDRLPALIERLRTGGWAYESEGALVIDVAEPGDDVDVPPLILVKSDGAVPYGTTDLATIEQRVCDYDPHLILYVVDKRQSDHFVQVFRSAHKTGIAPAALELEHIGFGTMNGRDGKPFKTREGGVMKLKDLIQMVTDRAFKRMEEGKVGQEIDPAEKAEIARMVGVAALKYADLMNHRLKDYVFDLDRFSAFEGHTGPYLLFAAVRIKSILRKAVGRGLSLGPMIPPASDVERNLLLKVTELPDVLTFAFETRAPNHLCEYAYRLATSLSTFLHQHHVLRERDKARRESWLALCQVWVRVLGLVLDLLGIEVPERM